MVKYNNVLSDKCKVLCGVPQGSILGPVLFLLYVNDIYLVSEKLTFIMYADDTNAFMKGQELNQVLCDINQELLKVSCWFQSNQLSLNVKKTHYMIFSNCKEKTLPVVNINGCELEKVNCTKFLGVKIDNKLSWKEHIGDVKNKLMKSIGIMYKMRNVLTRKWRMNLYKSIVLPHITYCNIVWASTFKSYLMELFITQKKALKLALKLPIETPTSCVFSEANVLTLFAINKFFISVFMYKRNNGLLPSNYEFYCIQNREIHSYNTRSKAMYRVPKARTEKYKFSIYCSGPRLWNALPENAKNAKTLCGAKCLLKNYFMNCE